MVTSHEQRHKSSWSSVWNSTVALEHNIINMLIKNTMLINKLKILLVYKNMFAQLYSKLTIKIIVILKSIKVLSIWKYYKDATEILFYQTYGKISIFIINMVSKVRIDGHIVRLKKLAFQKFEIGFLEFYISYRCETKFIIFILAYLTIVHHFYRNEKLFNSGSVWKVPLWYYTPMRFCCSKRMTRYFCVSDHELLLCFHCTILTILLITYSKQVVVVNLLHCFQTPGYLFWNKKAD